MAREHTIKVLLSVDELELLDELRGSVPRATWLRQGIHRPVEAKDIATYDESLALLTAQARDGRTQAAVELMKELRNRRESGGDDLDRLIRGD